MDRAEGALLVAEKALQSVRELAAIVDSLRKDAADAPDIAKAVTAEVDRAFAKVSLPKDGKDGESVSVDVVVALVTGEVAKAVALIPPAKDGLSGKDAPELTILSALDESKSYPRGTYASHWGGLVRANRNTDPIDDSLQKAGWDVLVDGLRSVWVGDLDDPRVVELGFKSCSGAVTQKTMRVPVPLDRGVFKAGTTYSAGDCATWAGSYWIAQKATNDKPGENDSWRLAVKKGRDGKDGVSVKGDKGDSGRNGRDLTHPDQPRY